MTYYDNNKAKYNGLYLNFMGNLNVLGNFTSTLYYITKNSIAHDIHLTWYVGCGIPTTAQLSLHHLNKIYNFISQLLHMPGSSIVNWRTAIASKVLYESLVDTNNPTVIHYLRLLTAECDQ